MVRLGRARGGRQALLGVWGICEGRVDLRMRSFSSEVSRGVKGWLTTNHFQHFVITVDIPPSEHRSFVKVRSCIEAIKQTFANRSKPRKLD